jgi:hypothetical protein
MRNFIGTLAAPLIVGLIALVKGASGMKAKREYGYR